MTSETVTVFTTTMLPVLWPFDCNNTDAPGGLKATSMEDANPSKKLTSKPKDRLQCQSNTIVPLISGHEHTNKLTLTEGCGRSLS
jgi:hypothetical protein